MRGGRHINGFKHRNRRTDLNNNDRSSERNNSIIGTIISALAGLIIKDISSPNSKIKNTVGNIFKPKQIEKQAKDKSKIIKAQYEVIENKEIKEIKNEK